MKKMRCRQDLLNRMYRRPDFPPQSSWVLCPIDMICSLFTTNHSLKTYYSNESIDLGPAYSTFVFPTVLQTDRIIRVE